MFKARLLPQKKQRADERFAMGEKAFPRLAARTTNTFFTLQVTVSFDIAIQRHGSWIISQSQWQGLAASLEASGMLELFLRFR